MRRDGSLAFVCRACLVWYVSRFGGYPYRILCLLNLEGKVAPDPTGYSSFR